MNNEQWTMNNEQLFFYKQNILIFRYKLSALSLLYQKFDMLPERYNVKKHSVGKKYSGD